ncbi:MAG: hypothetical protein ABIN94_09830 [Ferruginibacter sp.]
MKYALENLETLISTELDPKVVMMKEPALDLLCRYMVKITDEKKLILDAIKEEAYHRQDEKSLELLIHRYQSAVINLSGHAFQSMRQIGEVLPHAVLKEISIVGVYGHLLKVLDEILEFLEHNFSRYFNLEERLPETCKLSMKSGFAQCIDNIIQQSKQLNLEEPLVNILIQPFEEFIQEGGPMPVSYRKMQYLVLLQQELSCMLLPGQKIPVRENILERFLCLNFNEPVFINYYISIISLDVAHAGDLLSQSGQLAWWLRTIRQVQSGIGAGYRPKHPSAKDELVEWLINEIVFTEKKHQLALLNPPHLPVTREDPGATDAAEIGETLITSLSVKQLAFFARLLYDEGIIGCNSQTALLTTIATTFRRQRQDNISAGNLRVKYYAIDEPTKTIVRGVLMKLANQTRKY